MTKIDLRDRFLIIGAFRYALGRSTYVTQETAEWIIRHWEEMDEGTQNLIERETKQALESGYCGMDCDKEAWKRLLDFIEGC